MGLTVTHQLQSHAHGRVRFAAQGLRGPFIHLDDFTGMLDAKASAIDAAVTGNQFFKEGSLTDKDQLQRGERG